MGFIKKISTLLVLVTLCGCVHYITDTIPIEARAKIKKIAVISLIGDDVLRLKEGAPLFDHGSYRYWEITGWNIDQFVEETVISALSSKGRYEFVRLDPEKTNFKKLYRSTIDFDNESYDGYEKHILSKLQTIADSDVDKYIVVARGPGVMLWPRRFGIHGYGCTLYTKDSFCCPVPARLYVIHYILVVDAKTMQILARRGRENPSPYQEIGEEFLKDNLSELTPAELKQIEAKIKHILKHTILKRLNDLGL